MLNEHNIYYVVYTIYIVVIRNPMLIYSIKLFFREKVQIPMYWNKWKFAEGCFTASLIVLGPNLKCNNGSTKESLVFLDVRVKTSERKDNVNLLIADTDRHQYLDHALSHPKHIQKQSSGSAL